MARDNNTYAKRQRETLKRQKAEEKRERRKKRKDEPGETGDPIQGDPSIQDDQLVAESAPAPPV
jgi:hypothetical protein